MQPTRSRCSRSRTASPNTSRCSRSPACRPVHLGIGGVLLKDWDERTRSAHEIQPWTCRRSGTRSPARASPRSSRRRCRARPACRCSSSSRTTEPFENLNTWRSIHGQGAEASGKFYFLDTDLKIDKPQATVEVDRDKIARARHDACRTSAARWRDAGRRLRQLLQHRGPLLQGDPAGAAGRPPEPVDQCWTIYIKTPNGGADPGEHASRA
jgi:hypothetical protein